MNAGSWSRLKECEENIGFYKIIERHPEIELIFIISNGPINLTKQLNRIVLCHGKTIRKALMKMTEEQFIQNLGLDQSHGHWQWQDQVKWE